MQIPLPDEITRFFSEYETHVVRNLYITTQGIYGAKSTNLSKVKDELGLIFGNSETRKPESNYQRLIRFFRISDTAKEDLSKSLLCMAFCLLGLKGRRPKYLTLDGTSWELGEKKIHLMTLCVVVEGVSIPIWREELSKKGISNYEERKRLFEATLEQYDLRGMVLLADREYIG